ncbi:dicarboxylate carrier SLC25A8-like isoform X2 [Ostrea edulis]|uniref:dicarboxylate carrier SLC25A8-like isoform X2 n=1 Tax=Ostrea edulis TaxID=37623 RepID=UPI002094DC42|nr:dicarboxylate carrier SLC25A8-like isoform X2 [Ostrea edulis]
MWLHFLLTPPKSDYRSASNLTVQDKVGSTCSNYSGVVRTILTIFREEGGRGLYRGLVPGLQRQLCFSTIKLGCYDDVKIMYTNFLFKKGDKPNSTPVSIRILAGVTTGMLSVAIAHPTDVVKVRMQAQFGSNRGRYVSTSDAYKTIYTKEGMKGLWRGCLPNMTRNGIVNVAEVVTYDVIKDRLIGGGVMSEGIPCHLVSAFVAGFCATVVASPVDVVKTRYMNSMPSQYQNAIHCAMVLWRELGFGGFYKGFLPALLRIGTWNVLMFLSYEQIKLLIQGHSVIPSSQNVPRATPILLKDKHI